MDGPTRSGGRTDSDRTGSLTEEDKEEEEDEEDDEEDE